MAHIRAGAARMRNTGPMGIFKRSSTPAPDQSGADEDLATALLKGEHMIEQLATAHAGWGLGSAERWELDQETGIITWTFADRTATAPAQILGSHDPGAPSWEWAWADPSVLPALSRDAHRVREWAEANGHTPLTLPAVEADAQIAATFASIAVRVTRATGFYRGTGGETVPYITFGPVTVTTAAGETSDVTIRVED